jgi:hypothetical protein
MSVCIPIYTYIYTYIDMDVRMYVTYVHNQVIFLHALLSVYDRALHDDWVFLIHIQGKYKWHVTFDW